ncbi:MAG: Cas9 inhibitor AcrIIA9 family protein [Roseburia inulinivorans]
MPGHDEARFDCIFEELEERCEKSNMQRGCYFPIRLCALHEYAMKKIMEIRTPTEKEKELARKQEAPIVTPVSSDVLFEWIDEYYELDDKEAYEKEMQKQEAAQTSKKKKQTVKKPAKPLLDNLLGKEGGDTPDLKPSKAKKSRRKELDGQLSLFQI